MTSLICSFVSCGFVTDCQKGRLLGHMQSIISVSHKAVLMSFV